ncbi:hypothetical protein ACIQAL_21150 [Pseudomonas sp. NPDC088368]|jgi:hypothetical protein|uniref:hypothetical protein n=1 Tax=Pseudomonas sp. NPDC088368 TaxID=3364453 RepID=UPI0037FCB498
MAIESGSSSIKAQGVEALISSELGRCARSFESQANASVRGLHTALSVHRFKRGLPGRS